LKYPFRRQHRQTDEDEESNRRSTLDIQPQTSSPTDAPPPPGDSHQNQSSENAGSETGTQLHSSTPEGINLTHKIELHSIDDESAPNISLNLHGGSKTGELYAAALCGIVLQFGMLVFCGFSVYHPKFRQRFPKNGRPVQAYAFPVMALGTVILMIGMLICSAVVEQSTGEKEYVLAQPEEQQDQSQQSGSDASDHLADQANQPSRKLRALWLQKSHVVSDQSFDSYVMFGKYDSGPRNWIRTSRRVDNDDQKEDDNERTSLSTEPQDESHSSNFSTWAENISSSSMETLTLLGVFLGLCGFILQFQGLRGMNWSASIAQLVCTFLMTIWRAWIRRGLIVNPVPKKLREHHEMDWLALRIAKNSNFWPPDGKSLKNRLDDGHLNLSERLAWEILTNDNNIACVGSWKNREPGNSESHSGSHSERHSQNAREAEYALNIRRRLGQLTSWAGLASTLSIAVADSIEVVMNTLFDDTEHTEFVWSLKVKLGDIEDNHGIQFKVAKKEMWEMDATHIEAALSLWLFHISETQDKSTEKESGNDWLRKDKSLKRKIIGLLGPGKSEALSRDIKWWVGEIIRGDDKPKSNDGNNAQRSSGFTGPVGFVGVKSNDNGPANDRPDNETSGNYRLVQKRNNSATEDNSNIAFIDPLTVVSNVSLESSLAQHIFSSFMWAIGNEIAASKLDNKDETSIARGDLFRMDDPKTLLSLGLENKVLTRIANAIQQTGLGNLQEAYICIIPPLSCSRKLPVDAVVEFIRQRTREHEMLGRWERVVPVYIKLFQEYRTLGINHRVFQKVTAILIHLFISVSNTLKLWECQKRTDGIEKLGQKKVEILEEFNNQGDSDSMHGLIQSFIELYKEKHQDVNLLEDLAHHATLTELSGGVHGFFHHPDVFSKIQTVYLWDVKKVVGGNVDVRDIFNWTPLHYAAVRRDENILTEILKVNADPNATDLAEWTPLHYTIECVDNQKQESIVSSLLRGGADPEMRGRDGMGPLHCAAKRSSAQVIRSFLQAGASVDIQDNSRKTPLHWAAYAGNVDAINMLWQKSAYGEARDDHGRTALHLAAVAGKDKAVELLKDKVETNSKDRDGRTPLHLAAMKGNESVVGLLLQRVKIRGDDQNGGDAAINSTDNNSCTPLDLVVMFGHVSSARLFLENYNTENDTPKIELFVNAVLFGRTGLVELLVVEVDKKDIEATLKFAQQL